MNTGPDFLHVIRSIILLCSPVMCGQYIEFSNVRDFALYFIDSFYQGTVGAFTKSSTHGMFYFAWYHLGWRV